MEKKTPFQSRIYSVSTGNKTFYWTFVYMKLYNNSQKLHRVNHYTKSNKIVKHLVKNEGIHSNITAGHRKALWQEKNTPNSSTRLQRKFVHTQKYSSRQLIYTKATGIFLQHQILILYTASPWKVKCGFQFCGWRELEDFLVTERVIVFLFFLI